MGKEQHMELSNAEKWAQFRLSVIGSLLISPPKQGDLSNELKKLSQQTWVHPLTGKLKQWSETSIERWYYKAKDSNSKAIMVLRNKTRSDIGECRALSQAIQDYLKAQYKQHISWSVQLHYDNLVCAVEAEPQLGELASYTTVRRFMKSEELVKKGYRRGPKSPGALKAQKRLEQREVRSYEVEYANGLWHIDFHQGSLKVLTSRGEWVTPHLLAIIDDRSRLICHAQWYFTENTQNLVHGICQAFQKRQLPRGTLTDCGSAETAGEFTQGLQRLDILQKTTLPYSAYQNGKDETWWRNVEGRLLPMLEGDKNLTLRKLNQATQAWVELDYNAREHHEIKQKPVDCYLSVQSVGRECPDSHTLRDAFKIKVTRTQRKSDGSISVQGKRFEVPSIYRKQDKLTIGYCRWDLSSVNLMDPMSDTIIATLYPVNKTENANAKRRPLSNMDSTPVEAPASDNPPLLKRLLADYAATGLPQSYLPKDELENTHE